MIFENYRVDQNTLDIQIDELLILKIIYRAPKRCKNFSHNALINATSQTSNEVNKTLRILT